jgi:hypothetical protein
MNLSPSYFGTLSSSKKSKLVFEHWEKVTQVFETKDYKQTLIETLNYIGKDLAKNSGNAEQTEFKIKHGSIEVIINLTDTDLNVRADFIKLPDANKIPVLRKIAETNFYPLNLATIVLEDDKFYFKYSTAIELIDPYALYYVFKEICTYADKLDDELITKFGATRVSEPKVESYSSADQEIIYTNFMNIIEEAIKYSEYFDSKRWDYMSWCAMMLALQQLNFFVPPQGQLANELDEALRKLTENNPYHITIGNTKQILNKIKSLTKDEVLKNYYQSDVFIPPKARTNVQDIHANFDDTYKQTSTQYGSGDYVGSTMNLLKKFYDMFFYNDVPDEVSTIAINSLKESAGKDWKNSAEILLGSMKNILDIKVN